MKFLIILTLWFFGTATQLWADIDDSYNPPGWQALKGDHFVVLYPSSSDEELAHEILDHAENDYTGIADDIGYARYQNFWTWNNRVKIILFDDQASYSEQTGQPPWSQGFASIHSDLFKSRIIVTFKDQPSFTQVLLPHEITHLILHDFIGFDRTFPRFFDEGVAQLEQKDDSLSHMDILAGMISQGVIIPLPDLLHYDLLAHRDDARSVEIFYVESLYIVDFLVKTYGKDAFKELCRLMRDGKDFEQALKEAYYPTIDSMQTLQEKWSAYAKQFS